MDQRFLILLFLALTTFDPAAAQTRGRTCVRKKACPGAKFGTTTETPTIPPTEKPSNPDPLCKKLSPDVCCPPLTSWAAPNLPEPDAIVNICDITLEDGGTPVTYRNGTPLFTTKDQRGYFDGTLTPCLVATTSCRDNGFTTAFWTRNNGQDYNNDVINSKYGANKYGEGVQLKMKSQKIGGRVAFTDVGVNIEHHHTKTKYDLNDFVLVTLTVKRENEKNVFKVYTNDRLVAETDVDDRWSYGNGTATEVYVSTEDSMWQTPDGMENQIGHIYYWEQELTNEQIIELYSLGRDMDPNYIEESLNPTTPIVITCNPPAAWASSASIPEPTAIVNMCDMDFIGWGTPKKTKDGAILFSKYIQEGAIDGSSTPCLMNPTAECMTQGFSLSMWTRNDNKAFQNYLIDTRLAYSEGFSLFNNNQLFRILLSRTDDSYFMVATTDIDTSEWYMVTATISSDATKQLTLYINGEQLTPAVDEYNKDNSNKANPSKNLRISVDDNSEQGWWSGIPDYIENQVDHLYYWEQLLTDEQVKALYQLGRS